MYSFLNCEPVCFFMSGSNYCFLTCIQVSRKAGKVVWYYHLFKNCPQFVVIHTVKGFSIVHEAEVDVFLKFFCFSMIQWMLAIWSLVPLPSLNPVCTSGSSQFIFCWSLACRILKHYFASMWDKCNCVVVWTVFGVAILCDWNENWPSPVHGVSTTPSKGRVKRLPWWTSG